MSLYKQFWLSIGGLMAIVLVATLLVMSMAAKRYLEHHVFLNNVDRASVFAHRIEALGDDTEASRELLEKQFRSGQYEEITLTEANGELIGHWHGPAQTATVPGWFHRILALDVPAGSAQLNADTEVVTVRSQTRLADESMWRASLAVTAVCLLAAAIAGFLGTLILRKTLKPLQTVVHQANAIGQRRFITVSEPPSRELSAAVRAMNELSGRVKAMLEAQSVRLEKVQSTANRDELTGLLDREQFIRELGSVLQADDYNTSGVISLVRVAGLSMLNQVHGRDTVDSVLGSFGKTLIELQE